MWYKFIFLFLTFRASKTVHFLLKKCILFLSFFQLHLFRISNEVVFKLKLKQTIIISFQYEIMILMEHFFLAFMKKDDLVIRISLL